MKRYSKYKDSGVPWLGHVPSHWPLVRYKYVFNERVLRKDSPLPAGAISYGKVVLKDDDAMHVATKASYQEVLKGDFLVNPINLNYDLKSLRTALSEVDVCVSPAYIVLRPSIEADSSYLKHQLYVFDVSHMKTLGAGVRQTISFKDIGNCWTVIPPRDEQEAISSYLDDEVNRIDATISSQERMIELLKGRRSAIIAKAVTKGLDPKVKMKDSGVPWIGQIPAHWELKKLRHLVHIKPSNVDKKTIEGEPAVRLCNYTDVYYNERIVMGPDYMEASASDEQIKKLGLRVGDVVITKDSEEPDDIGIPACVYETAPNFVCGYHLALLRPEDPRIGPFIARAISSTPSKIQFHLSARGVTRYALGYHGIADLQFPLPPLKEAQAICGFIDKSLSHMDAAIASQTRMIERLKERRLAVIMRAVTGQIDVR